jgi:hypothetical protein
MPSDSLFGLYGAKVIDNNDPDGTGRVLVHIYRRDGVFNYSPQGHTWVPVLSPYGGNREMGMFMLPPIHAEGFVMFEGGDPLQPVWVGAYPLSPKTSVDEDASNQAGITIFKTAPTIPPEAAGDPTTAIIKTQYPGVKTPDIEDDVNRVENLIVMNEKKMEFAHINQTDYTYNRTGIDDSYVRSYITLKDNSLAIGVRNSDGEVHEISVTSSGIKFQTADGGYVQMSNGSIEISGAAETKITIKTPGAIEINGKQVMFDGESLLLGPLGDQGGAGVVTSDAICPYVGFNCMVGSSKLTASG